MGAIGRPMSGVEAKIIDENNKEVPRERWERLP